MAIRIRATPDANGIITVSCGADTIEIEVAGGQTASGNPFDPPFLSIVRPHSVEHIVGMVAESLPRPKPGPHTLLLHSPAIDVHHVAQLGARLSDVPGLQIVVRGVAPR